MHFCVESKGAHNISVVNMHHIRVFKTIPDLCLFQMLGDRGHTFVKNLDGDISRQRKVMCEPNLSEIATSDVLT